MLFMSPHLSQNVNILWLLLMYYFQTFFQAQQLGLKVGYLLFWSLDVLQFNLNYIDHT